ncbi:hypothetical protein [Enterococcus lactis]|nr:hypothetical protein [Enterococcus lactis]
MDIYNFAKLEFEKRYDSLLTVSVNEPSKVGSITKPTWVPKIKNQPCRIAQKRVINPISSVDAPQISYVTILYCDSSLNIPAGSRIEVTDTHGLVRKYKRSAEGFSSYRTHQEIAMQREETA